MCVATLPVIGPRNEGVLPMDKRERERSQEINVSAQAPSTKRHPQKRISCSIDTVDRQTEEGLSQYYHARDKFFTHLNAIDANLFCMEYMYSLF